MNRDAAMRRHALHERLPHQGVAKSVPRVRDDQDSPAERRVEQGEGFRFREAGQGHDLHRVQVVARQSDAFEHRQRSRVEVHEVGADRIPEGRGDRDRPVAHVTSRELASKKRMTLRQRDDSVGDHGRGSRFRLCSDNRDHVLGGQGTQCDLDEPTSALEPREAGDEPRRQLPLAMSEHHQERVARVRTDLEQDLRAGFVGEMGVVDDQDEPPCTDGRPQQLHESAGDTMTRQGAVDGGSRARQRRELRERRARTRGQRREPPWIFADQSVDHRAERPVRVRLRGAPHGDGAKTGLLGHRGHLATQERLSDAGRPPNREHAHLTGQVGAQQRRATSQLHLPPDEGRLDAIDPFEASLVQHLGLGTGRNSELRCENRPQPAIPTDGAWEIVCVQRVLDHRTVGRLVRGLELDEALPTTAEA